MRIAMIGQKGIPATHGGIERHVEELAAGLAARGHEVTVYCRRHYCDPVLGAHRGVRLRHLPSLATKHLDAISHSMLAALDAALGPYDIVHFHAVGPALVSFIPRLTGKRVVVTVHGRDWERRKWGPVARTFLRLGERMAVAVPHRTIAVSSSLARALEHEYGRVVVFVPNGIAVGEDEDRSVLTELGLQPGGFVLFAGRLVPEKGLHHLIAAWARLEPPAGMRLVVAGDTSFSDAYVEELTSRAAASVVFAGYVYGPRLNALFRNTALFVFPSELEGLPIVLLEAAAQGVPVLASDIEPCREVLGDGGAYFESGDVEDLGAKLAGVLGDVAPLRKTAELGAVGLRERYSWENVVERTEAVYVSAVAGRHGR
jgi:glycosyltransferase involved in cell wall biosynthesis